MSSERDPNKKEELASAGKPMSEPPTDTKLASAGQPKAEPTTDNKEAGDEALICPVCGLSNRPGELACSRCGTLLANNSGTTRKLETPNDPSSKPANWPTGEVIVADQEPITLEIGDAQVVIPLAEVITIGRISDASDSPRPDVDLSAYGADDQGVSRKHIKIKRKNILVYVADLGSTNGTLLNGRRLIPNAERLLRNGDVLQLGHLKIKVKF